MLKLSSHLPLLILLFIAFSAAACAQEDKTVDQKYAAELKKIYKEFDDSGKKRDISTVEKYLADNYELQRGEIVTRRAEVIKGVKAFYAMVEEISEVSSTIEKIEVADGNYFLEVTAVIKGKIKLSDGRIVPFESIGINRYLDENRKRMAGKHTNCSQFETNSRRQRIAGIIKLFSR